MYRIKDMFLSDSEHMNKGMFECDFRHHKSDFNYFKTIPKHVFYSVKKPLYV